MAMRRTLPSRANAVIICLFERVKPPILSDSTTLAVFTCFTFGRCPFNVLTFPSLQHEYPFWRLTAKLYGNTDFVPSSLASVCVFPSPSIVKLRASFVHV